MLKRVLSLVMAMALAICCTEGGVFAEEADAEEIPTGVMSYYSDYAEGLYNSNNSQGTYQVFATELIAQYSLSLRNDGNRRITIKGETRSSDEMKKIGFTSIKVQRWNGSSWVTEKTISDQLVSKKAVYTINYSTTVAGGYDYKVSLNHYAKESGLFGSSQSVFNETSYLWIE
ncbi:MAG: hypothetical protein ACERKO_10985 [Acetanaerobacterium sp.]